MRMVFVLFLIVSAASIKAQRIEKDSLGVNRNPSLSGYYIDGIRLPANYAPVYMGCGVDIPFFRIEGTTTINQKQLASIPQRNVNSIAGTVAGVDSRNGQTPNIRGARQDGTAYYIDGIRVNNTDLVYDLVK